MKRTLIILSLLCIFGLTFSQNKVQKITLMSDVYIEANWQDSVLTATYYDFQLLGTQGKIKNMKVKLKSGTFETLKDNKYRVKLNPNDTALELTITKFDPMTKQDRVLTEIKVPVKK